jgi:hypothetical protein
MRKFVLRLFKSRWRANPSVYAWRMIAARKAALTNDQKLSHGAGDIRQSETRSEN